MAPRPRNRHTLEYRPSLFKELPDLRCSINVIVNVSPEVPVKAEAQLLDFPAEGNIFAESEMKIDEETRLAGCLREYGCTTSSSSPFRMGVHCKGDFFNEAVLWEVILRGFQPGQHGLSQASKNDPSRDVGIPLRLELERFKTVCRFGKNPVGLPVFFICGNCGQLVSARLRIGTLFLWRNAFAAVNNKVCTTHLNGQEVEVDVVIILSRVPYCLSIGH